MKSFGITKRGLVRPINEDAYYISEPSLFILADGMGGHTAGEVASRMCIDEIRFFLQNCHSELINEITLKDAVLAANRVLRENIKAVPERSGMGTTVLVIYCDGPLLFWAHVGDSRIYRYYRGDLSQVTTDHSLVNQWLQDGSITEEQATNHPSRNVITRSVGTEDHLIVDTGRMQPESESMILMCSDGLYNMVNNEQIRAIMIANEREPEACARYLLREVYMAGAKDNVTIVTLAVQ